MAQLIVQVAEESKHADTHQSRHEADRASVRRVVLPALLARQTTQIELLEGRAHLIGSGTHIFNLLLVQPERLVLALLEIVTHCTVFHVTLVNSITELLIEHVLLCQRVKERFLEVLSLLGFLFDVLDQAIYGILNALELFLEPRVNAVATVVNRGDELVELMIQGLLNSLQGRLQLSLEAARLLGNLADHALDVTKLGRLHGVLL